ncbi:MAG: hypothetical protein ACRCYU_05345 [Nocardioides sp.]
MFAFVEAPKLPSGRHKLPLPLLMSAVLVTGQGLFFVGCAVLELVHLSSARLVMGLTTCAFLVAYGGTLAGFAGAGGLPGQAGCRGSRAFE